jgi:hypothetical protein
LVKVERLRQHRLDSQEVGIGQDVEPASVPARHRDDREFRGRPAELRDGVDGIPVGELEIQQHQVRAALAPQLEGLEPPLGHDDPVLPGFEHPPERVPHGFTVIDDQDEGHLLAALLGPDMEVSRPDVAAVTLYVDPEVSRLCHRFQGLWVPFEH